MFDPPGRHSGNIGISRYMNPSRDESTRQPKLRQPHLRLHNCWDGNSCPWHRFHLLYAFHSLFALSLLSLCTAMDLSSSQPDSFAATTQDTPDLFSFSDPPNHPSRVLLPCICLHPITPHPLPSEWASSAAKDPDREEVSRQMSEVHVPQSR